VAESSSEASDLAARPVRAPVRDPGIPPVVPSVYFAVLFIAAWIALAHEVLVRLLGAYLDPGFGPPRLLVTSVAIAALVAGLVAVRKHSDPRRLLGWLLVALSLSSLSAAPVLAFAFAQREAFVVAVVALPTLIGFCLGSTLGAAHTSLGRTVLRLGAVEYLLNPFRLLVLAIAFGGAAAGATLIGLLRSGAIVGLVLAALAIWAPVLLVYLERQRVAGDRRQRAAGAACFALGLSALGGAELIVPLEEQAFFEGDIVYASRGPEPRHFVLSVQDSFELFREHSLRFSTLDQHRYFESLVRPALAAAPGAKRALVFGAGDGMAERELLRSELEQITVVVADRTLADLARSMPWLVQLNERALSSPKVTLVEEEPLVYLEQAGPSFDLALVDLPDPEGYAEGKHYTRHFFQRLARRLAPHGVVSIQTTSPFTTPKSAGSVVATLRAAGFDVLAYRTPLPTLGEWGFALASPERLPQPRKLDAGRFLTTELFAEMSQPSRDAQPAAGAPPSYLYDQAVVALFEQESAALLR
jgi:spermidine synthase